MPEGDTVLRTATRLHQALADRVLTRTELRWADLGGVDLAGRRVVEVRSHGKQILTRIGAAPDASGRRFETVSAEPLTLRSHLRMEGRWAIVPPGDEHWPRPGGVAVRAVLGNQDWTAVGSWLGLLDLIPTAEEPSLIGHLGPDILAPDFPVSGLPESVRRLAAGPDRHLGAALLDQTTVAGIGTMYMAETLFLQRLSPWTRVGDADLDAVLRRARRLLERGATQSVQTTTHDSRPGMRTFVHARSGRPCHRCGTTVRVAMIGPVLKERTAFWCPTCQPGPVPTDDGRPQTPLGSEPRSRRFGDASRRPASGYRPRR
ncbi:DNA-formamidopyrimidine glycosylase family protein [Nakamurella leprariae]|uniref:DNA-(apurinic or apyrimidinic site) lyase n=1 Tax=Nakamurella leprariae TaxID=2803911 RepID=A0A938YB41_9ACTN|nr:DNA-formamidopyrimidine glycosylase family protein [Nakamurella leprariae]MBM9466341.1 Fpg/Nei family DNA glycosylase [Nakamurella leprariae]